MMSSSDSFTNFETTIFFRETEFVYSFLCILNINKNIYLISWEKLVKICGEQIK